jgi:hypothetical protein
MPIQIKCHILEWSSFYITWPILSLEFCLPYLLYNIFHGCVKSTSVLNKLRVWVWHSPKLQKGASIFMPNKLHVWVGTASAAEMGKIQYSCFFLKCLHSEKNRYRFLLFLRITMLCSLSQEMPLHLMLRLYIMNSLEVEGGWWVSIQVPSLPGPSFMHVWSSVCSLFLHLLLPSVRFIGQAHVGHERWHLNWNLGVRCHLDM